MPDVDEALRGELALGAHRGRGARLVERILLPALNVRGLASGRRGGRAANAIPTEARASIDFRLVPDQTPEEVREQVEAHLRGQGYNVVHGGAGRARRGAASAPRPPRVGGRLSGRPHVHGPAGLARGRARGRGGARRARRPAAHAGRQRAHVRCSQSSLGRPVIGLPIANHDNNQHAANENLRLQNLWDGIEVYAAVMTRGGRALGREVSGGRGLSRA